MEATIVCPACKGAGQLSGFACPGFRPVTLTCSLCLGTGSITVDMEKAKRRGETIRAARLRMDMSQREYAQMLGISPMALSRIEHGQDQELGMVSPEKRQQLESDMGEF